MAHWPEVAPLPSTSSVYMYFHLPSLLYDVPSAVYRQKGSVLERFKVRWAWDAEGIAVAESEAGSQRQWLSDMRKVIMLAGPPRAHTLKQHDLSHNDFLPAFLYVIDEQDARAVLALPGILATSSDQLPRWRRVEAEERPLETGWSQQHWVRGLHEEDYDPDEVEISFLAGTADSLVSTSEEFTQFLERSHALQEETSKARIVPAAETPLLRKHYRHVFATPHISLSSFTNESPSLTAFTPVPALPTVLLGLNLPNLTSLASIPSSTTLASLEPQTVTVDLIVGIISVMNARSVTIRRTGRTSELVEVLVGDDTKRGFGVTFWLPDSVPTMPKVGYTSMPAGNFRGDVLSLRRGDVVCMKNIGLSCYKGAVHGQSLGKKTTSLTKLNGLKRLPSKLTLDSHQSRLIDRLHGVSSWTRQYVPDAQRLSGTRKRKFSLGQSVTLPADETPVHN